MKLNTHEILAILLLGLPLVLWAHMLCSLRLIPRQLHHVGSLH